MPRRPEKRVLKPADRKQPGNVRPWIRGRTNDGSPASDRRREEPILGFHLGGCAGQQRRVSRRRRGSLSPSGARADTLRRYALHRGETDSVRGRLGNPADRAGGVPVEWPLCHAKNRVRILAHRGGSWGTLQRKRLRHGRANAFRSQVRASGWVWKTHDHRLARWRSGILDVRQMEGSALFVGRRETLTRGRLRYCQTEALVALARAKLYHNPLTQLLKRGENLWLRLDHRETLLVEMQDLGRQIDAAYRRFETSPRRDGDAVELQRAQSSTQKLIEEKRSEAERIAAQCHEYYRTSTRRSWNSHKPRRRCFLWPRASALCFHHVMPAQGSSYYSFARCLRTPCDRPPMRNPA